VSYEKKKEDPQGGEIKKVLVWNGACAAIPYHSGAHLMMDWRSAGMTRLLERCVAEPDADGLRIWREMVAQTVDPLPNGRLHVEKYEGYFRLKNREFWATSTVVVDAVPIANGVAFAFRTNCPACKDGPHERLHIITPSTSTWGDEFFAWHTLLIDKGTTGSVSAVFNLPNLDRWKKATKANVTTGSKIGIALNVVFRIDTSQLVSEDKPRVAVGRTTCAEDGFRCD
jgi:hypothetical protein